MNKILIKKIFFLRFSLFLIIGTAFISINSIHPHHTGTSDTINQGRAIIDPFTGKRVQAMNYVVIYEDIWKGARENKNIYNTNIYAEMITKYDKLAFNINMPYIYYDQKDRKDAARYGSPFIGVKYSPILGLVNNLFWIIEGRVGFPSGKDTDKFTNNDFYQGVFGSTIGYLYQNFAFSARVGGIFPFSKLNPKNQNGDDGVPYYFRTGSITLPTNDLQLKKAGLFSLYLSYYINKNVFLTSGYIYRTPYDGIEYSKEYVGKLPTIFREYSVGVGINFLDSYSVIFSYRKPFYRSRDYSIYESAYSFTFSYFF